MRKWIYGALATAGSLGLILTILLVTGVFRSGENDECSKLAVRPGSGPLISGTNTTVAGAQSVARYVVPMPDVPAARLANLTQTEVFQRNVALVFDRGKVTITMRPAAYRDSLKLFRKFVSQSTATEVIGDVHGQPALVISPRTDGCGSNPALVEFKHDGIDIRIYSSSYGTDTLLTVADSFRKPTASGNGR
jgi:hypothetical protein